MDRAESLADAMATAARDVEHLTVVVSGDIAFAGTIDEYELASAFLARVRNQLAKQRIQVPTLWIAIPGNHDCDHFGSNQLRPAAISRPLTNGRPDPATLGLALDVQRHYQAFANRNFETGDPTPDLLVRTYTVQIAERKLVIQTINAAWCSTNPEIYGQLWLPETTIRAIEPRDGDLTVAVLHYPLNWFDGTTRRDLRRAIDASTQLILTGHEHEPSVRSVLPSDGYQCERVAAAALQDEDNPTASHFSVFIIDAETMTSEQHSYSWSHSAGGYVPASNTLRSVSLIKRRVGPVGRGLEHTPEFEDFLDDLGAPISHPNPNARHLSDFFVWPDMSRWRNTDGGTRRVASSATILESEKQTTLIAGTERAGKTSLAKRLVREWSARGRRCLWVNAPAIEHALTRSLEAGLAAATEQQYGEGAQHAFDQLVPSDKALIIDDFHLLSNEVDREALLKAAGARFDIVVILVSDEWIAEQTASSERFPELFSYQLLRLLPCGPSLRHQLVSKWVQNTPSLRNDAQASDRQIESIAQLVDGLIGHDLVAPYPSALLIMLQSISAQGASDVNHGSLGHTYHTLIHMRLSHGVSVAQTNMRMRYLTEFAWAVFSADGESWTVGQMDTWHREHMNRFDLGEEAKNLPAQLLTCGMLELRGGMWHFRHKYVYFYFVAEHINQHLHTKDIQDILRSLVLRLYNEDASNIFSFVAFKTRNELVLQMLLDRAGALFAGKPECDIANDCAAFDSLAKDVPKLVFAQERRADVRASMLAESDGRQRGASASYGARDKHVPVPHVNEFIQVFTTAVRLVTVLGQVVRNHAGQLEAERMQELVRCTYSLSMRMLGVFLDAADKEREALVKDVVAALKERNEQMSMGELQTQVSSRLVFLVELAAFGILKHAGTAVGMGELVGRTLQDVLAKSSNTSVEFIDTAIQLDRANTYPRERMIALSRRLGSKPFAIGVLRLMVLMNLYLIRAPEPDRQAVCGALGIEDSVDKRQLFSARTKLPMTRVPPRKRFKDRLKKRRK